MADTPPTGDALKQAIDEATRVLCKTNRVPDGDVIVRDKRKDAEALAKAGLLAVPAPAVDRERLIRLIADASNHNPFPEAEDIADTLIDVGMVR